MWQIFIYGQKTKLDTLEKIMKKETSFLNGANSSYDNPNKMVIGSGTSLGSDINIDHIEIRKSLNQYSPKIVYVGTAAKYGPIICDHIEIHGSVVSKIKEKQQLKSATVVNSQCEVPLKRAKYVFRFTLQV